MMGRLHVDLFLHEPPPPPQWDQRQDSTRAEQGRVRAHGPFQIAYRRRYPVREKSHIESGRPIGAHQSTRQLRARPSTRCIPSTDVLCQLGYIARPEQAKMVTMARFAKKQRCSYYVLRITYYVLRITYYVLRWQNSIF